LPGSIAARSGNKWLSCVTCLLRHGADVNLADISGDTALSLALRFNQKDLAMLLLEYGATFPPGSTKPTEVDRRCYAFLHSALPDEPIIFIEAAFRLVTKVAAQWLFLRNMKNSFRNPPELDFDDNLRQAFQRETELFFESILNEDRSVLDLLTADYTFLNERLARHYGIAGIYGSQFRRLNRTEYDNAIYDLFVLNIDATTPFPPTTRPAVSATLLNAVRI
jgi:ankyrin repeat protein